MYVTIFGNEKSTLSHDKFIPLTIGGNEVKFFNNTMLAQFNGRMSEQQGTNLCWYLDFFNGTPFKESLWVMFSHEKPEEISGCLSKAIWQSIPSDGEPKDEQLSIASQWLRRSNTLKFPDHKQQGSSWLAADGQGVSMFTSNKPQFQRVVLLLALACAYRRRVEKLTLDLSRWDNQGSSLLTLARSANEFNARCYFRYPVKLELNELPSFWTQIASRLELPEFNAELVGQTNNLNQLVLDFTRDENNRRWQRIGLWLGVISAIQVLGLIPDDIRAAILGYVLSLF